MRKNNRNSQFYYQILMKKNKLCHVRRRSELKNFQTHVPNLVSSVSIITNQLQIPSFLKQNLVHENRIIKRFLNDPQAHLKIFYYQLLKICFQVQDSQSINCIQKIYELIDDDQFQFNLIKDEQHPCYLQLSTRKIKRVMNQFFQHIQGENISIDIALSKFPIMDKIFTVFMRTLLILGQKVEQFDQFCNLQTIYTFLSSYFEIDMNQYEKCLKFDLMDTFIYEVSPVQIYLIYIQASESQKNSMKNSFTSQSSSVYIDLDFNSEQKKNQKIELISEININDNPDNSMDSVYQDRQMIKRAQQSKFALKTEPNQRKFSKFKDQQNKSCFYINKDTMTSTMEDGFLSPRNQKPKTLSQMTSRKQSIQLSIYQQGEAQNQYSQVESMNTILTLKKLGELTKKKYQGSKMNIQKQKTVGSGQKQNEQNKLTFRRNTQTIKSQKRSRNISKISSNQSSNKIPEIVMKNKNPIRMQDLYKRLDTYVSYQTDTIQSINFSRKSTKTFDQELQNQVQESGKIIQQTQNNSRFSKLKPTNFLKKSASKIDLSKNVYSKFGYIDMNISNQFTNSFILNAMRPQFQSNIREIKQHARFQRETIKKMNSEDSNPKFK